MSYRIISPGKRSPVPAYSVLPVHTFVQGSGRKATIPGTVEVFRLVMMAKQVAHKPRLDYGRLSERREALSAFADSPSRTGNSSFVEMSNLTSATI